MGPQHPVSYRPAHYSPCAAGRLILSCVTRLRRSWDSEFERSHHSNRPACGMKELATKSTESTKRRSVLLVHLVAFLNLIVKHLTDHGVMDTALLYESPFTDLT